MGQIGTDPIDHVLDVISNQKLILEVLHGFDEKVEIGSEGMTSTYRNKDPIPIMENVV
jgi:hypothetical protein